MCKEVTYTKTTKTVIIENEKIDIINYDKRRIDIDEIKISDNKRRRNRRLKERDAVEYILICDIDKRIRRKEERMRKFLAARAAKKAKKMQQEAQK